MGLVLSLAGTLVAEGTPNKMLVVNGKTVGPAVVQIDGRSYVDIETLAMITNGVLTVEPSRVVLTISGANASAAPPETQSAEGMSKDFARAAVGFLAELREWRGAIGTIIGYGIQVVGAWPQDYRDHAESSLAQVALVASTSTDQASLQLVRNEFSNEAQWAADVVATRQSLNATKTVDPNAMQNDPLLTKISDCSRFLSSMLVSGVFADNPSCH